ncbi:MAG TPA: two-component regulator propeller domain-containing protein, partial [Candidatus Limnocylindria bacterium]|nr:two-component regulator propeller domain-containing protein [Candidatus Limnocylindria bacterium]
VAGIDTIRDHHVHSLDIGSPFDSSNATADRRVQIVWPQEPDKLWYGPDQVRLLIDGHPAPTPFTFPPEAVHPESIFEDREHNMWFGAIGWALKWDGKQLQRFAVEPGENREAGVRVIFQDRVGRIWCGTYGQGITLLQGETNIVFKNPIPAGDSKRDRLERKLSNQMWTIHEDGNGIFWIGTENGLIRFVPPGVDPKLDALAPTNRFFAFRKENGLPDLVINHVLEDDAGNLWLGALHGIYKVARSELNSVAAGTRSSTRFVRITGEDGLLSVETNGERSPSACKSRDGRLWFPTDIGVAVIDPTAIATKAYTPEVLIESVAIDHVLEYGGGEEFGGEVLPPSPSPSKRTSGGLLRLNPGRARLVRIKYTAPSTIGADQMDFSIQLVGVDTTIRQMRKERVVHYSNLPPGTYEFRVTATNGFGEGALRPATFAFVLEPFFWQTWPFKIFCVVVAIVVAGGIQTYRLRIQRRIGALENAASLEQERSRIAQDLHDELGSGLAQVALLAEMPESETTVRRRPQDVAREMLNKLDGIVWALNPARASLESVVDYLVGHAEEFLEPAGVHLRLHIVDNLPDSNLDAARRHHLLLVFKESLRNVVTHSQAKNVAVEIGIEPTGDILRLRVTVRDDGKGFDPQKLSGKRNGLTNMRERASQVGGEVTVKSSPGQGTEVVLAIPLVEVTPKRGRG